MITPAELLGAPQQLGRPGARLCRYLASGCLRFPCLPMCFSCQSSQAIDLGRRDRSSARADLQLRDAPSAKNSISDTNNYATNGYIEARAGDASQTNLFLAHDAIC
jgi:hypothetical protein